MKGIYPTRERGTTNSFLRHGDPRDFNGSHAGIISLEQSQNQDGSWGIADKRSLTTPLVLTAILGSGESLQSQDFGECVRKAQVWVMANNPTGMAERIASAVALSVFVQSQYREETRSLAQPLIEKAILLLRDLAMPTNSLWTTYLMAYGLPAEVQRSSHTTRPHDVKPLWRGLAVDFNPTTLDGYLKLCVATCLRFHAGGKEAWDNYNRELKLQMIKWQREDGFYPCADEADRFACTALALESRQLYFIFRTW